MGRSLDASVPHRTLIPARLQRLVAVLVAVRRSFYRNASANPARVGRGNGPLAESAVVEIIHPSELGRLFQCVHHL